MSTYTISITVTADTAGVIGPVEIVPAATTAYSAYTGTVSAISVSGATSGATAGLRWTASYGGMPVSSWYGTAPGGPFEAGSSKVLTVTGTDATPGATYTLTYSGRRVKTGEASIPTAAPVSAFTTITGSVTVSGPVTVSGNVGITGTVAVSGAVAVSGPVTVSGNVGITGTVAVSGTVAVTGPVTVSGDVGISGPVSVSGAVDVTGPVTVGSITDVVTSQIIGTVILAPTQISGSFGINITPQTGVLSISAHTNYVASLLIKVTGQQSNQVYFSNVVNLDGSPVNIAVDGAQDSSVYIKTYFTGGVAPIYTITSYPSVGATQVIAPPGLRLATRNAASTEYLYYHLTTTGQLVQIIAAQTGLRYIVMSTVSAVATSNGQVYWCGGDAINDCFLVQNVGPNILGSTNMSGHVFAGPLYVYTTTAVVLTMTYAIEGLTN